MVFQFYISISYINSGKLPEGIAQTIVTPLYKGGAKCEPRNYRPIALTNHLTKIFERILKDIVKHLETNNIVNKIQHGFTKKKSTISQLLNYYQDIITMVENKENVDTVYLDFSKAFDKVDHKILLQKLHQLGIRGKIHRWIKSFLTNRQQRVLVEGFLSEPVSVISGILSQPTQLVTSYLILTHLVS